jgi:zinc/manganese transport system substrate-binding protein
VHPYGNPHIQTGPGNILAVAAPLAERLAQLDPAHAQAYRAQQAAFAGKWRAAMTQWTARAKPLAGLKVVSAHKGWIYLYEWLGMQEVATLEPKPGIPPSAGHLERVLGDLQRTPARMVIRAAYQDPRPAQWLSDRLGIPVVELPFSVGGARGADDLFGLFDVTLERLLQAAGIAS